MKSLFYIVLLTTTSIKATADTIDKNLSGIAEIYATFNHQLIKKSENRNYHLSIIESERNRILVTGTKEQLDELVLDTTGSRLTISRDDSLFSPTQTKPVNITIETSKVNSINLDGEFSATINLSKPHKKLVISLKEGIAADIANIQTDILYLNAKYGCEVKIHQMAIKYTFARASYGSNITLGDFNKLSNLDLNLSYGSTWNAQKTSCENCILKASFGSTINFKSVLESQKKSVFGSTI